MASAAPERQLCHDYPLEEKREGWGLLRSDTNQTGYMYVTCYGQGLFRVRPHVVRV